MTIGVFQMNFFLLLILISLFIFIVIIEDETRCEVWEQIKRLKMHLKRWKHFLAFLRLEKIRQIYRLQDLIKATFCWLELLINMTRKSIADWLKYGNYDDEDYYSWIYLICCYLNWKLLDITFDVTFNGYDEILAVSFILCGIKCEMLMTFWLNFNFIKFLIFYIFNF